jgi:hypothetical protein
MDMFDFIKARNLPILTDIDKDWFKQLWFPLTIKGIPLTNKPVQGPPGGALETKGTTLINSQIVLTKDIFDFMGTKGSINVSKRTS